MFQKFDFEQNLIVSFFSGRYLGPTPPTKECLTKREDEQTSVYTFFYTHSDSHHPHIFHIRDFCVKDYDSDFKLISGVVKESSRNEELWKSVEVSKEEEGIKLLSVF